MLHEPTARKRHFMHNFRKMTVRLTKPKEIENQEQRSIELVCAHHLQKTESVQYLVDRSILSLWFARSQTAVAGALVALVHQSELIDTLQPRRYANSKNIADISICRSWFICAEFCEVDLSS